MSRTRTNATPHTAEQERAAFAQRLQSALTAADTPVSATRVQREFNVRSGQPAITAHAARKWLMGESIPTQERIRVLAAWLGVTAGWLRLGDAAAESQSTDLSPQEQLLLKDYRRLRAPERKQISALIATMADRRGR